MKPFRVSIAALLGVIAVCALGFMGLREGKPIWATLSFSLTLVVLLLLTLQGILGSTSSRPGSIGFALFGWVYLATVFGPWGKLDPPGMVYGWGVDAMLERVHPQPEYEEITEPGWQVVTYRYALANNNVRTAKLKRGSIVWSGDANCFRQTAHSMGALLFGACGLIAARLIARHRESDSA